MRVDPTRFPVLMLDMNGTFMFGQDRFGPDQDYHATYAALGGQSLTAPDLTALISAFVAAMSRLYRDHRLYDAFPSVAELLRLDPDSQKLGPEELALLESVIAHHELGEVPQAHTNALARLAQRHDLILVSNIWSRKDIWVEHLRRTGTLGLFAATVFSSDHFCIKPGKRIYDLALASITVGATDVLFIGDDPECDILAPRRLGMATMRVRGTSKSIASEADWVIDALPDLAY